ncbi:MAG: YecA family protein [Burkholderia sp.]|jgi:hypothetical protein
MTAEHTEAGAVVPVPQLGDPSVLAEILMYSARNALKILFSEGSGEDYSAVVFSVASIFMGETDSLALPDGWDPDRAGEALREGALKETLSEMAPEDRATFSENSSMLVLAVMTCFQEAAAMAQSWGEANRVSDTGEILKGMLHDPVFESFYLTWAKNILGSYAEDGAKKESK